MKKTLLLVLCTLLFTNLFSQCVVDTSNIYEFTYNGKTYEVIKELENWNDAAACAVVRGGYLVEINSQAEQTAVYDAIINGAGISTTYVTVSNGGGIAYVWIGATDINQEGTWLWDGDGDNTGTNFWVGQGAAGSNNGASVGGAYFNWGGTSTGTPQEPDNYGSGQDCGAIGLAGWPSGTTMLGSPGEWNDIIGSSALYYVIEYDSSNVGLNSIEKSEIMVYPNPTSGLVNIVGEDIESIEVVDFRGQVVIISNVLTVDLSGFACGIYFFRIVCGDGEFFKKVLLVD